MLKVRRTGVGGRQPVALVTIVFAETTTGTVGKGTEDKVPMTAFERGITGNVFVNDILSAWVVAAVVSLYTTSRSAPLELFRRDCELDLT